MPKYCDSAVLESNWFEWIIAEAVPTLEPYRELGKLWTKVIGKVADEDNKIIRKWGKPFCDPGYPIRSHCIGLGRGIFVITNSGKVSSLHTYKMRPCKLPYESPAEHFINIEPFDATFVEANGYRRERPVKESWDDVLRDIYKMCNGISKRFNMPSDEDRNELANEAALQVIRKLKRGKLVYTPGKAPVFNLLTTTIHRCMYSALSRDQRRARNARAYAEEIKSQHV
jgi:hypothetical protein